MTIATLRFLNFVTLVPLAARQQLRKVSSARPLVQNGNLLRTILDPACCYLCPTDIYYSKLLAVSIPNRMDCSSLLVHAHHQKSQPSTDPDLSRFHLRAQPARTERSVQPVLLPLEPAMSLDDYQDRRGATHAR